MIKAKIEKKRKKEKRKKDLGFEEVDEGMREIRVKKVIRWLEMRRNKGYH